MVVEVVAVEVVVEVVLEDSFPFPTLRGVVVVVAEAMLEVIVLPRGFFTSMCPDTGLPSNTLQASGG